MTEVKNNNTSQLLMTIFLILISIVIIYVVFRKNSTGDILEMYKYKVAQKDSMIAERNARIQLLINAKIRSDSALIMYKTELENIHQDVEAIRKQKPIILQDIYEKTPAHIRNYSRDDLRRAFNDTLH